MRALIAILAAALVFTGCAAATEVTPRNGTPTVMAFVPVKGFMAMLNECGPINPDLSLTVTYTEILPPGNSEQFFRMGLAALTSEAQSDCLKAALFEAGGEIIDGTGSESGPDPVSSGEET